MRFLCSNITDGRQSQYIRLRPYILYWSLYPRGMIVYYILGSKILFWKDPVIHIKCIYYSPYNTCVYREEADNDFVDGPSTVETKTSKQAQELIHSSSVRQTIARPTRWIRSSQQKKFLLQLISNKLLLQSGAILILQQIVHVVQL